MRHIISRVLVITGCCGSLAARAEPLSMPMEAHSLETVARSVTAIGVAKERVIFMPHEGDYGVSMTFDSKGADRAGIFGKLTDQHRQDIGKSLDRWEWRGVDILNERVIFLDGQSLTVVESDPTSLKEITRRSLAWDLIKPPRDRSGEPTRPETDALRARFKQRYVGMSGLRISGMATMPGDWAGDHAGKKRHYLLATRVPGFPLVQMDCDANEASICMITRQCYVEGAKDLDGEAVTGIAVSASRHLVIIGDKQAKRLVMLKFHSCYHVPMVSSRDLPPKLKTLTNITVDQDDRLWLTTATPDDYLNASLFYWDEKEW